MKEEVSFNRGQIIYISHGGGPMPILGDPTHKKMIEFMEQLPKSIHEPDVIIVFSAHWEEDVVTIQSGHTPDLVYDYYGFPEAAYTIKYPCKGDKNLAKRIGNLFKENGIDYYLDDQRPYDHGAYIPLKLMYPQANIPVIQISLNHNLHALDHLKLGKALRPLMTENILFIGSGFSFHNMSKFDFSGKNEKDSDNDAFQNSLIEICCDKIPEEKQWDKLISWQAIQGARYCHPREEHLLPLMICMGLSNVPGKVIFDDYILGKRATGFLWA